MSADRDEEKREGVDLGGELVGLEAAEALPVWSTSSGIRCIASAWPNAATRTIAKTWCRRLSCRRSRTGSSSRDARNPRRGSIRSPLGPAGDVGGSVRASRRNWIPCRSCCRVEIPGCPISPRRTKVPWRTHLRDEAPSGGGGGAVGSAAQLPFGPGTQGYRRAEDRRSGARTRHQGGNRQDPGASRPASSAKVPRRHGSRAVTRHPPITNAGSVSTCSKSKQEALDRGVQLPVLERSCVQGAAVFSLPGSDPADLSARWLGERCRRVCANFCVSS